MADRTHAPSPTALLPDDITYSPTTSVVVVDLTSSPSSSSAVASWSSTDTIAVSVTAGVIAFALVLWYILKQSAVTAKLAAHGTTNVLRGTGDDSPPLSAVPNEESHLLQKKDDNIPQQQQHEASLDSI